MLGVILLDQVLHDGAGFEKADGFAVGEGVCQCRNPSVGIDFEEPWLFLRVLGDVNLVYLVIQPGVLSVTILPARCAI